MKYTLTINGPEGQRVAQMPADQLEDLVSGRWAEITLVMTSADPLSPTVTIRRIED